MPNYRSSVYTNEKKGIYKVTRSPCLLKVVPEYLCCLNGPIDVNKIHYIQYIASDMLKCISIQEIEEKHNVISIISHN